MTTNELYDWILSLGGEKILAIWMLTASACMLATWAIMDYRNQRALRARDIQISALEDELKKRDTLTAIRDKIVEERKLPVNIFADTYHMKGARMPEDVPSSPQNIETHITCPECNWHGTLRETIKSYGHTICPYCRKEFREISR